MDTGQFRFALRPLELKHFFDFALRLYRANFAPMLLSMAMVQLPLTLLSLPFMTTLLEFSTEVQTMSTRGDMDFENFMLENLDKLVWGAAALFGAMAYQVLVMPLGNLTCAKLAAQSLLNDPMDFRQAFNFALSRYWATQVSIATFLLPLLALSVLALLPVLAASSFNDSTGIVIASSLGVLGIFLGAIATVLLFFRYFAAVNGIIQTVEEPEGEGMLQQGVWYLKRSWSLTQSHYFRVLGYLLLLLIAVNMITSGIQDSVRLLIMFFGELGRAQSAEDVMNHLAAPQDPVQTGIAIAISGLITAVIPPVWQCFKVLLYFDLRCRKEGTDLFMLLDQDEPAAPTYAPGMQRF